jgi:hypothetical protein
MRARQYPENVRQQVTLDGKRMGHRQWLYLSPASMPHAAADKAQTECAV